MDFKLKTWYKKQDRHGNSVCCLSLYVETANSGFRGKIQEAIEKALYDKPAIVEKQSSIGFCADNQE